MLKAAENAVAAGTAKKRYWLAHAVVVIGSANNAAAARATDELRTNGCLAKPIYDYQDKKGEDYFFHILISIYNILQS